MTLKKRRSNEIFALNKWEYGKKDLNECTIYIHRTMNERKKKWILIDNFA